mgnify:CR=1 FL=1
MILHGGEYKRTAIRPVRLCRQHFQYADRAWNPARDAQAGNHRKHCDQGHGKHHCPNAATETGYSSLTYLKRLPVDVLKIDQSFIRDATRDPNDAQIIRAIVAMATSLKLETIAEGVEYQEQLDFLIKEGCHAYQGYLFSPPVTFDAVCELLAKHR